MTTSREEHLNWCKKRAHEYLETGDLNNALASMLSDLGKHPDTQEHPFIQAAMVMKISGLLNTVHDVKKFIDGFN